MIKPVLVYLSVNWNRLNETFKDVTLSFHTLFNLFHWPVNLNSIINNDSNHELRSSKRYESVSVKQLWLLDRLTTAPELCLLWTTFSCVSYKYSLTVTNKVSSVFMTASCGHLNHSASIVNLEMLHFMSSQVRFCSFTWKTKKWGIFL